MRRADRLFQIVQALRGGRLTTARDLARRLEVSERTVYRDVAELIGSGVPIAGEAGLGYILRDGYDVPPLMFTRDELEAVLVGVRMVRALAGSQLAAAATEALAKVEAVVPEEARGQLALSRVYVPAPLLSEELRTLLDHLRQAIGGQRVIRFAYTREDGERSERSCQPLGLYFWGKVWTVVGWCELRDDFRTFRVDRMRSLTTEDRRFSLRPGRTLADFLRRVGVDPAKASGGIG